MSATKKSDDLVRTLFTKLYQILNGGDEHVPAPTNRFVAWCSPGIAFDPEEFTYCSKGLSGGKDAEEDKTLLQQAYNFSTFVDFVPDLTTTYSNDRQQTIYHTPQARLSSIYGEILKFSKVVSGGLSKTEEAKLKKFRGLLTHTYKYKDPITDAESDKTEDSAMVKQYTEKFSAYTDAILEYNNKRITAAAATGPEGKAAVADWAMNAATYRRKVKSAMDAWVSVGYKNEVDQINAYINQVTQRDMMLWKQALLENYGDGLINSLGPASQFYYATMIPGGFATAKGWTNFSFKTYDYESNQHSKSNAWGANAGVNFGFWSAAASAKGASSSMKASVDMSNFSMSFDLTQVPISRPWFFPEFFMNKGWTLEKGNGWMYNDMPSDGKLPPKGNFIGYPTSAIFARNVVMNYDELHVQRSEWSKSISAGGSVGIGPFRVGGSYSSQESDKKLKVNETKNGLTVGGMQLIGLVCNLVGKSPDPLPEIKKFE
jgi:hypothetical protein